MKVFSDYHIAEERSIGCVQCLILIFFMKLRDVLLLKGTWSALLALLVLVLLRQSIVVVLPLL